MFFRREKNADQVTALVPHAAFPNDDKNSGQITRKSAKAQFYPTHVHVILSQKKSRVFYKILG